MFIPFSGRRTGGCGHDPNSPPFLSPARRSGPDSRGGQKSAALFVQAIYNLFFPSLDNPAAGDIDIVVRTSSAAIFGYFLSANFIRHTSTTGQAPAQDETHILETGGESSSASGPLARIGFDTGSSAAESGGTQLQTTATQEKETASGCLQIRVATAIGLCCLVALLVVRNLSQWGLLPIQWEAVSATAAQLRDFVSGCVGFLIGCPTVSSESSGSTP